jgi:LuxR family maltose regulon positive regulatory protein
MRLWLVDGDLPAAKQWVAEAGLDLKDEITFLRDIEHISLLRLLLALGSQDQGNVYLNEALAFADRLLMATQGVGWVSKSIPILILKALSYQTLGKFDGAMGALRRAIRLARLGGYVSVFIDEGDQIEVLLEAAGTNGRDGPYVQQLLAAIRTRKNARPTHPVARQVNVQIESLIDRELQVLRLLESSLTVYCYSKQP